MYENNDPERIALNKQIKEWNANRLDLFEISEPNDYLEFYGVMRFFFQGDDLKYQSKCIRVSSTATTQDVIEALVLKFHPDLKMLNNDKYVLYESHNAEDRKMKNGEFPLIVQLHWALDDKDGKFILRNETRRRRSEDMTNRSILSNNGLSSSTSVLINGNDNHTIRTQSSSVYTPNSFLKRFASSKKSKRKNKDERDTQYSLVNSKRMAEEISGKPPESSFTRTISNPDDVMKRRRQKKLEYRLEQFSGMKGNGETGGTLKIYGESINPDIPYKTLLLSVNDTAEKVLSETLDKYGLSSEDHRFYVLVQQNIPPRDDRNRGNIEEIILHEQDCPLGILVHCPPKRGSATFAVRRATPLDEFPSSPRMPPSSIPFESTSLKQNIFRNERSNFNNEISTQPRSPNHYDDNMLECPRLIHMFMDADGSLYDLENGVFSIASLLHSDENESFPLEGSRFIKIGSQPSTVGDPPNILLSAEYYPDIRPIHCHISVKQDSQTHSVKFQITPTLDSTSRTPRPCVLFINQQRIDSSTRIVNGDMIQLGECVIFLFEEFIEEPDSVNEHSNDLLSQEPFGEDSNDSLKISYFTADLPISVKYKFKRSHHLIDCIIKLSEEYAERGSSELFSCNTKFGMNNMGETFKLSPAYVIYLVIRAALADEQQIAQLINLIANRLDRLVQDDCNNVEKEIFWLSNSSEMLHLLQYDNDLRHYSVTAQDILASAIERAFSNVQHQFSQDIMILLPALLSENDEDIEDDSQDDNNPCLDRATILYGQGGIDYPIQHLLQTLSLAFTLFHNCQVNVALTIQMFSQLFHLLNTWLFNTVMSDPSDIDENEVYPPPVCREWGIRLMRRLNRIRTWSEINGLEMAANCHLQKMYQVAELMEADKRDLNSFGEKCIEMVNINGAQLHHLLTSCQDYVLPDAWIEVVVNTAIQLNDREFNNSANNSSIIQNKNTLPLFEDLDLRLPLLLPADGYCCDRGIVSCPIDLKEMLNSLKDLLIYKLNPPVMDRTDTRWKSYLGSSETTPTISRSNTIKEQSYQTPQIVDAPYLPRNWVNTPATNKVESLSETVSSHRERYQKKSSNTSQSPMYSKSQSRQPLPIPERQTSSHSDELDGYQETPSSKQKTKNRFQLKLLKINNSIGLSIIAAKASDNDLLHIYVKDVIVGGAGYKSGKILVGDQLVSIDGNLLEGMTQDEAVRLMKKTKAEVTLTIEKGAAQEHGVMEKIIQARNNKINNASQKSQNIPNNNASGMKKPISKSTIPPKSHSSKVGPQLKSSKHKSSLPLPPPTEKAPPRPPRLISANNPKPPSRAISNQNIDESGPRKIQKQVAKPMESPIYATVKKLPTKNKADLDKAALKSDFKPGLKKYGSASDILSKDNNLPNLNSSLSASSGTISSTDEEDFGSLSPKKETSIPTTTVKVEPNKNIKTKNVGIPRYTVSSIDPELKPNDAKIKLISRPVISQTANPTMHMSSIDDSEPISLNKPVPISYKNKKYDSSSESESESSNTESTSSSDHSPQPQIQTKSIQESPTIRKKDSPNHHPEVEPPSRASEPIPQRKTSTGVPNLGGFKNPLKLTTAKSNEQMKNFPSNLSNKFKPNTKVDNGDDEPSKAIQVVSHSPITVVPPPPAPTASYPQYHRPHDLQEYNQPVETKFEPPAPPSEDEIKLHKQQIKEKSRRKREDLENISHSPEYKPADIVLPIAPVSPPDSKKDGTNYGRPQFNGTIAATRPATLSKPDIQSPPLSQPRGEDTVDGHAPAPKSRVIGANEVYRDPHNKANRNSNIDTNQDGVEELPFREKMKLFAEKIGENEVVDRKKVSSKQRKMDSGDYT